MKILVADRDGGRASALAAQLQALDEHYEVITVKDGENLLDCVGSALPDIVLVDMARSDRDGLDSIRAINAKQRLPIVLFVDEDDPAFMEEAIAAGVSSYHNYRIAALAIKPILRTAMAFFRHTERLNVRLADAEEKLQARQAIEAAKRLLMTQDKMNEPAAHRFLQRRAMHTQMRLAEAAQALLRERGGVSKQDD